MIKNKDSLLEQIATELKLNEFRNIRISAIKVVFKCGEGATFEFDLPGALHVLANDLYWDERGDWRDAHTAEVRIM